MATPIAQSSVKACRSSMPVVRSQNNRLWFYT